VKVVFATPTVSKPYAPYLEALEASIPAVKAAGFDEACVFEIGNPYISSARSIMTRKALDAGADAVVYIDHDLSWEPADLVKLLQTDGEVVAGTYRFKKEQEEYMGAVFSNDRGTPLLRSDGCIKAEKVPAGFLKVTKKAIQQFMRAYPQLLYGEPDKYSVDLFNHGAHKGVWYGEDYAFSRNWIDCGGEIWIVPNLNIDHHTQERAFRGNFHRFLLRQPGGSEA